jgi:outer membrane protein OmpA-like peptidoglycan-associated protein
MSGYPVTLEVGHRGQSLSVSGLAPSEAARSQLMARLATDLPGVVIADKGLAALPARGPDLSPAIASMRKDLGQVESALRSEVGAVERQAAQMAARMAALRSLERAGRRLEDATPDLEALSGLQQTSRRTTVEAARALAAKAAAAITVAVATLRERAVSTDADARVSSALAATGADLRRAAQDIAGLIGGPAPTTQPSRAAVPSATGISDAAELVSLSAERLATVSAAALQAASIRIPEPPRIPSPTAVERLKAYAARNAIFFANNEDYRDPSRAAAVLDEVARLTKEARVMVRVVGYTDERGGQSRNNQLAQSRAEKIAQALLARGVPKALIVAVGRATGPDLSPVIGPESANRRAEFEIAFDGEPAAGP